jgi:peptide deformylase
LGVYQIIEEPDEVLRAKALPVNNINAGVIRVLDNMRDTLYAFDGVGLAAPQIGVSKRIIVVDPGDQYIELINPEIIEADGEQVGREGCLSVPNLWGTVKRANRVVVRGLNREAEPVEYEATELLARAFQHEIDHLDGVLFIDKASDLRRGKD